MAIEQRALRARGVLNAYQGTSSHKDNFTVTQVSSIALSALDLPTSKFRVLKRTIRVGGVNYDLVTDISVVTA